MSFSKTQNEFPTNNRKGKKIKRSPPVHSNTTNRTSIKTKKKNTIDATEKKQAAKLLFSKEEQNNTTGVLPLKNKLSSVIDIALKSNLRNENEDSSDENVAVDSLNFAKRLSEVTMRQRNHRNSRQSAKDTRLKCDPDPLQDNTDSLPVVLKEGEPPISESVKLSRSKPSNKNLKHFYQKKQQQEEQFKRFRKNKNKPFVINSSSKSGVSIPEYFTTAFKNQYHRKERRFLVILVLILIFILLITQCISCATAFFDILGSITSTSWPASDEDITKAETYYTKLEAELQAQIDTIEESVSSNEEYSYNIGEITHDPVALISYLCARYGAFTFNYAIQEELNQIFALQYTLTTSESTEFKTTTNSIRVGDPIGNVTTSGYCNCELCCGEWAGGPTASGVYPQAAHTIAVDINTPTVPLGTEIIMNGILYKAEDTGNFAHYGVDFDVYYNSHSEALAHGHQNTIAYYAGGTGEEIEVITTNSVNVHHVTLNTRSFINILESRLTGESREIFDIYQTTLGNRPYLGTPVNYNWKHNVSCPYGFYCKNGSISMNYGMDLNLPAGTDVLSPFDGIIEQTGENTSDGKYIVISDSFGTQIRFSHCERFVQIEGTQVSKGDIIAKVGSTGSVSMPVLHIEYTYNNISYNPYFYFETGDEILITGLGSSIPATEEAANLIQEATKYLGTPYVWGGYSPSGFDCSGYVSYCLTNSGVKNTGHMTCAGLIEQCTLISKSELQPGDLVFFQGTYKSGLSHVGIYIGSGEYGSATFIHCGDPCQYANLNSSYWIEHWYTGGRWY